MPTALKEISAMPSRELSTAAQKGARRRREIGPLGCGKSLSTESTGGPRAPRSCFQRASGVVRVGGACGPPWSSG